MRQPLGPAEALAVHRGSNQMGVRAYNERLAISLLWRNGALSKTEIARLTGLSLQAVSVIMRQLEADGLLTRGDKQRGRVGQPSTPLSLNPDGAYAIGVKIGRRSTDVVLVDLLGRVRGRRSTAYPYPRPEPTLAFVEEASRGFEASLGAAARRLAGVGVAMPFELWSWSGEIGAPPEAMIGWRDLDVRAALERSLGRPVHLHNDATAACAAEMLFGGAAALADVLYLFVGTFIGGGLALNHGLFTGRTGNAAAIGSLPVRGPGGAPEQLIDQASLLLLERRLEAAGIETGGIWAPDGDWTRFEPHLTAWIEAAAPGLAYAVTTAAALVEIEAAVVDGLFPPPVRDRLIAAVAREIDRLDRTGIATPALRPGRLGALSRAVGGAALALADRYLIDQNTLMRA